MKKDFSDMIGDIMLWTMMAGIVLGIIFGKLLGMIELGGIFIAITVSTPFIWIAVLMIYEIIDSIRHKNSNK